MKKKIIYFACVVLIVIFAYMIYKSLETKELDISKSLVYIESLGEETIKSGTGFVYKIENSKNYILTNYHVIEECNEIYVYNAKKEKVAAHLFDYDIYNDIAILSIDDVLGLKEVSFADSSKIKKKDKVYVVGSPNNINNFGTINAGYIVGSINYLKELYDFDPIEINVETDFGSSGSPVLNDKGKVIGIIFLRDKDDYNKSYFIPINFISDIIY